MTNLQWKTDTILYTNKNSYVLIIKKHAKSGQLPNKTFFKLKFLSLNFTKPYIFDKKPYKFCMDSFQASII